MPRMTHFEKLSFYSGGNLYVAALSTEHNSNLKHKSVKPYHQYYMTEISELNLRYLPPKKSSS